MKLRPFAFISLLFATHSALAQGTRPEPPLKISLSSEEPSGVFFDRDTLVPQTPLLFTARIENPSPAPRQVSLSWKITDANGRVRLSRGSKFSVAGNDSIIRRELFDAPARGGYLLQTVASSRLKGPDTLVRAALPFAVTLAPSPGSSAARPRSFFVLTAPALLSGRQLDFYSRLGARVLRSPLPPDPARPNWDAIETQLGERLKRNLATIALLPLGGQGLGSQTFFARQVPTTLSRYGSLSTWELSGDLSPADLDAWSQLARSRRSDISLLGPLPADLPENLPAGTSIRVGGLEGATFDWPDIAAHPAALRRLWLSRAAATRRAGLGSFHLRRDVENETSNDAAPSPGEAAGEMTQDYLSAIMAGASSMSETLSPPAASDAAAETEANAEGAAKIAGDMARGAAFSMLSRTLEDAAFREALFPRSPAFEGALFRAPRGSIAVVYATRDSGKMLARVGPARVFDLFGNLLASDRGGSLEIPLSGQPVYILAEVPTDVLEFALRGAKVTGIRPLAAQFLPLSRLPGSGEGSTAVRVRLQNIGLGEQSGQLRLQVPSGWKLATSRYEFRLGEGESKTYEFRATTAPFNTKWPEGRVPLGLSTTGSAKISLDTQVPMASALNVAAGEAPRLDGDLDDWSGALWQTAGPNGAGVSGKVAFKWDETYLYIAAQVREAGLTPRRPDEAAYEFWKGHDALQIAFGTSDGPETVPAPQPFRDSSRGFLLSPFGQRSASGYDGRILRLWGAGTLYNQAPDRVRYGGVVAGANCVITRAESAGLTSYEARLPWSAVPEVSPAALAAKDGAVRFGWVLHNDEGAPLDWARAAGSFPWWSNTATFLPAGRLTSPLRSTLGFSGPIPDNSAPKTTGTAPSIAPTSIAPTAPLAGPPPGLVLPAPPSSPPAVSPSVVVPSVVVPSAPTVVPPAPRSPLPPPSGPLETRPSSGPPELTPFILPPASEAAPLPPAAPR